MIIAQMFLFASTYGLRAQEICQRKNEKKSCEEAAPLRSLIFLLLQETLWGPQKLIY